MDNSDLLTINQVAISLEHNLSRIFTLLHVVNALEAQELLLHASNINYAYTHSRD